MFALNICLALNLIILFVAFFFRKNNALPNKILALILLDTAISFLGNASITGGIFEQFPYFFFLSWCTNAYFGPLVFAYTCLFTGAAINLKHPIWLVAFLLCIFGWSFPVTYLMLPVPARPGFAASLLQEPLPWQMTVINIVGMLLILASVAASAIKIARYKRRLFTTISNLEKTKLSFITKFVALGGILTLITSVLYLVLPQYLVEYLYLPCLITLIYFFILYYSFRHHAIFTTETYEQFLEETRPVVEEYAGPAAKQAAVPQNELEILAARIEDFLMQSGTYTDPDFTINMLADNMRVPVEKISAAINKVMNKNFFELVNEKRVDKAKLLLDNKINQITIEAIAYESGFNSRASFYRAFKKYTALTPSEYLSQLS
ncbi:helix-turn-helix domain-containing protein [Niabella drilacis]|uniref:Helix-turn-helix domain-containing protein n=1 Tax=Niabella drilacis (strain DSM 25811 / CCM 8410 / CCUG 62505 / LMG 26954 / E90) TaxID=1285928 RepID=A0A1G6NGD5_NIADE|nr:AraC family transcriptional regulator [Niabella drilacis]SDC66494.1 Helix-turn-helix domain-containing protein [Niabella drilacis]